MTPKRGVRSTTTIRPCAYCGGVGRDPYGIPSKLSACQVCLGRGNVRVSRAAEGCLACKGTGHFATHRLPCSVCGGKGAVMVIHGHRREWVTGEGPTDGLETGTGLPPLSAYTFGALDRGIGKKRA